MYTYHFFLLNIVSENITFSPNSFENPTTAFCDDAVHTGSIVLITCIHHVFEIFDPLGHRFATFSVLFSLLLFFFSLNTHIFLFYSQILHSDYFGE